METESETCAALLHNVVEDSDWTIEMLAAEGIPSDALEAIKLLTHKKGIPYMEYVESLKKQQDSPQGEACRSRSQQRSFAAA